MNFLMSRQSQYLQVGSNDSAQETSLNSDNIQESVQHLRPVIQALTKNTDTTDDVIREIGQNIGTCPPINLCLKGSLLVSICLLMFILSLSFINGREVPQESYPISVQKPQIEQEPIILPNLVVHLVPHSHDDVGWLKTVDQYFYGANNSIQFAGVQYTIDTVVTQLTYHPQYKFSIVQMAFLYRWWRQASDLEKKRMKALVTNGQIEFLNAGWCASDEATIYYEDFIDQMTVGLRWLKDTFDYIPDVAWHIDPFGHQASTATLFSKMGFNSIFFARIDYEDKIQRLKNKQMQMVWRPPTYDKDPNTYIFAHSQYRHYSSPPNFYFDAIIFLANQPIIDDPLSLGYNVKQKSEQLVNYFKTMSKHYKTMNLIHTMGQDFTYTNARMQFKNLDKLLNYINKHQILNITIKYSTPGEYIKAIQREKKVYPNKADDFFPYADYQHSVWTGYFTSRPALKGFIKDMSRFVQTVRKHIAELKISRVSEFIKNKHQEIQEVMFGLQTSLGILQHHDGVSGTAKQHVTDDYVATGLRSVEAFNKLYKQIKKEEIQKETGENINADDLYVNLFWNESGTTTGLSKTLNDGQKVLVSFYNPGSKGSYPIRLRVPNKDINIVGQTNAAIIGDVICGNLKDTSDCQLLFSLQIRQSSSAYVKLMAKAGGSAKVVQAKELTIRDEKIEFPLGNDKVKFIKQTHQFELTLDEKSQIFTIFYNYYEGWGSEGQKSGAYIFRPISDTPKKYSDIQNVYTIDGKTNTVFILEGTKTLTRIYFSKTLDYVRKYGCLIQTQLSSIPVDDNIGKQVTLNIKTDYKNGETFFTDSMGLEEQQRTVDYRATWEYTMAEHVAGNYYPINSFIRISNMTNNINVTVVTDRSQGGAVIQKGEFQIMIHRRLLQDDGRGVVEALNQLDTDGQGLRQTVRHYLVFGNHYRSVQKWNDQRILPVFSSTKSAFFYKVLNRPAPLLVPETVKLYLRPFQDGTYLLRFHNTDPNKNTSVTIRDEWLLDEQTLAANQKKSEWKKKQLKWREQEIPQQRQKIVQNGVQVKSSEDLLTVFLARMKRGLHKTIPQLWSQDINIELKPFEMRTFKARKVR